MALSPVARVSDTISHGGQIVTGLASVIVNGRKIARKGDRAQCRIHGLVTITSGSPKGHKAGGKLIARRGDSLSCGATITSGSPNVNCA